MVTSPTSEGRFGTWFKQWDVAIPGNPSIASVNIVIDEKNGLVTLLKTSPAYTKVFRISDGATFLNDTTHGSFNYMGEAINSEQGIYTVGTSSTATFIVLNVGVQIFKSGDNLVPPQLGISQTGKYIVAIYTSGVTRIALYTGN